jgi:glycosyltransferase involved in cell wall biosynthesis
MTLRVTMLIHDYFPLVGGAQNLLRSQVPYLRSQGVDVTILTRRTTGTSAFELIDGVEVHRLPAPEPRQFASLAFTLSSLAFLLRRSPDLIHANEFISPATAALLARRFTRKPVVITPHRSGELGDVQRLQKRASGQARLKAIRDQTDAFVVISDEIGAELRTIGVPEKKLHSINNGVDVIRFSPLEPSAKPALRMKLGLTVNATLVIFTGRLVVEKRVNNLLAIWPAIRAAQPQAELLVLGEGNQMASLTAAAGEGVHFFGAQRDVAPFLNAADIFVLPSSAEGLSIAMLEAMSCGLPPVMTNVGGSTQVIEDGQNGLLVHPDDLPGLQSGLEKLIQDASLRSSIGAAARRRIEKTYSVQTSALKLSELYLSLARPS